MMRADRSFLQELSSGELEAIFEISNVASATHTVGIISLYVVVATASLWLQNLIGSLVWLAACPALGFILAGFMGAIHDCTHSTQWSKRSANRWAGTLWSTPLLLNFTIYRYYHLQHHRHTSVEGDTEPQGEFDSLSDYLRAIPCIRFFASFWRMSFEVACGHTPNFMPMQSHRAANIDTALLILWAVAIVIASISAPSTLAFVYLFPLALSYSFVFMTSIPEHYGCGESDDIWTNTRTITSNSLFRFMFWNGNFHAEHHIVPGIPSRKLPIIHKIIRHRFMHLENSYITFHIRLVRALHKNLKRAQHPLDPTVRVSYSLDEESRQD